MIVGRNHFKDKLEYRLWKTCQEAGQQSQVIQETKHNFLPLPSTESPHQVFSGIPLETLPYPMAESGADYVAMDPSTATW